MIYKLRNWNSRRLSPVEVPTSGAATPVFTCVSETTVLSLVVRFSVSLSTPLWSPLVNVTEKYPGPNFEAGWRRGGDGIRPPLVDVPQMAM